MLVLDEAADGRLGSQPPAADADGGEANDPAVGGGDAVDDPRGYRVPVYRPPEAVQGEPLRGLVQRQPAALGHVAEQLVQLEILRGFCRPQAHMPGNGRENIGGGVRSVGQTLSRFVEDERPRSNVALRRQVTSVRVTDRSPRQGTVAARLPTDYRP